MPQKLIEGIVDRLLSYYEENLPAKAVELNQRFGGDLMETPQEGAYYAGELGMRDGSDWPKLFVLGERTTVTRYSQDFTDADHEVVVKAAIKALDAEDLQRSMYRWGIALWELTVSRFFSSTGDDYFALHGQDDITIEYERPEAALEQSGELIGRTVLRATFSKQEDVT